MSLISIALSLLLAAGLVDCIRLPIFVQDVFGIGQPWIGAIPQFILDTEHVWLKDNKRWLSRYPDVRRAICDKTSSLWQSTHENGTRLPQNLFHNLEINNNRVGISRLGWKNAADRLTEMKDCRAALQDVHYLQIDIYVHDSEYSDYTEDSMPPPGLATLFAEVLPSMTNLKRLDFGVSGRSSAAFEKGFAHANVTLPSITHLRPGAYSDWLLPRCPNVEIVEAGSYFHHWSWNQYDGDWQPNVDKYNALIDAMQGLSISRLTLFHRHWSLNIIEKIVNVGSNLTFLDMEGPLNEHNYMRLPEGEALKRYISKIAQLSQLEELRLPDSSDLDLGFDGGYWH